MGTVVDTATRVLCIAVNGVKVVSVIVHGDSAVMRDVTAGPAPCADTASLSGLVVRFLDYVDGQGKSESTVISYGQGLRAFADWLGSCGIFALAAVTPRHVADWKSHLQRVERLQPATVNLKLVAVSRFFHWAVVEGLAPTNPAAAVKQLSRAKLQPHALSEAETQALVRAAEADGDLRNIAIVELMLGAGLRVSELLALRPADLVLTGTGGKLVVRQGKGGKFREIPIPLSARRAMDAYLETVEIGKGDTIWQGTRGCLATGSAIKKILKRLAAAAGIAHIHPHMLRHTFARRYLDANPGDLRGLATLLGHASLNTTMIYTEPTMDDLAVRVQRAASGLE